MSDSLDIIAASKGIPCDDNLREKFIKWAEEKYAQEFIDGIMEKSKIIEGKVNDLPSPFRNGRKGSEYSARLILPACVKDARFVGLESLGLTWQRSEANASEYVVSGVPIVDGEQEIVLEYYYDGWIAGTPPLKRMFRFAINPDPRDLWKEIPVPDDIEYPKPDTETDYVRVEAGPDGAPKKDMVAASRRGRSHAHEGKPRDDHFLIRHCPETDWYILAVADGAGSAEFSREGSRIACTVAVDHCEKKLSSPDNEIDSTINEFWQKLQEKADTLKNMTKEEKKEKFDLICKAASYEVVVRAAFLANKAIHEEADSKKRQPKSYATTLLLAVCKKIRTLWYIIAFNIGDGAIGALSGLDNAPKAELLCSPDEGEFSGQTRFLTMNDLFSNSKDIVSRIHPHVLRDLNALILMTDGVSDAKFETDANLRNPQKWNELWNDLSKTVHFEDDNQESKNELLEWLNFWSPGNHDDRTIAILY